MENNVLFVDDEVHILKAIKRGLYKEKYNKFFASSPQEALEILEREEIHVIVSDMKMPGMTGLELLTIVKDKYPDIVKIILSGYTQLQQIIVTINRIDIYKFVTKPWDMEGEFQAVIISAIQLYNTRTDNERLRISLSKQNEIYQRMLRQNDEKLKLMKDDFKFIETLNHVMSNIYYLLGIKMKSGLLSEVRFKEELDFVEMRFSETMNMMPTTYDDFNSRILQDDLKKFLKKVSASSIPSTLTVTCSTVDHIYRGVYKVLFYTLSSMLMFYYDTKYHDDFSLIISEKVKVAGDPEADIEEAMELLILLKSDTDKITTDRLRLQSINTYYYNLVNAFGGLLSFERRDNKSLVLMRLPIIVTNKEVTHE